MSQGAGGADAPARQLERWMREAIAVAREGVAQGQTPFGCVIVRDDEVLAKAHNEVWRRTDITAHAEVNALRRACAAAGDVHLQGAAVYTTTEPCPMCFAACHWAHVEEVVFGAGIADAERAGFRELAIPAETMAKLGRSDVRLTRGVLAAECAGLFEEWRRAGHADPY